MVHEVQTSKCCVLCSLQQLTSAPVTCQLFLPTLLPVDYISSPASSSARHIQEEAGQGGFFWHISGYSKECWQLLEVLHSAVQWAGGEEEQEGWPQQLSQVGGWDEGVVPLHSAQVDHGSVVGHLHRLADAGFASLHHLQLVHGVIHAQGKDFVPWQPLPATERSAKTCHLLPRSSYPHLMYLFIINASKQWYKCLNPCIWHRRSPCSQNAFWAQSTLSLESSLKPFNAPWSSRESWKSLCSTQQQMDTRDVHGAKWVFIPKKALSCSKKLKALGLVGYNYLRIIQNQDDTSQAQSDPKGFL